MTREVFGSGHALILWVLGSIVIFLTPAVCLGATSLGATSLGLISLEAAVSGGINPIRVESAANAQMSALAPPSPSSAASPKPSPEQKTEPNTEPSPAKSHGTSPVSGPVSEKDASPAISSNTDTKTNLIERELLLQHADPKLAGRIIFDELDRRHNSGYVDFDVQVSMHLVRKPGLKPVVRDLRIRQLEHGGGDLTLVVFDAPAAIRGTALLTHAHMDGEDEQWLYLPAFKRVKKITTHNRSGAFVQSEFSYEDLSAPTLDKYAYHLQGETPCGEQMCYVVERTAVELNSGYAKELYWIDQDAFVTHRITYFDERDEPLKVLQLGQYKAYSDQLWKPHHMRMENLRTKRVTELVWNDYQFGLGLDPQRDFSVAALRRSR